ncbi:MAG: hypothetical protein LBG92_07370 [Prevotellaceae bacterium]|jgi:hypothetical protein|nr:hypothetical protein [Prevotellaceae bacterium]
MLFESIYLAESHNFHNRRSLTVGRNSETITLPVKAELCGAENIEFWLSASFFGLCLSVCQTTYGYENSGFQPVHTQINLHKLYCINLFL